MDQLVTCWCGPPATGSKSGREAPGPGALAAPPRCDTEVSQASSQAESLVKFPAGIPRSCGGSSRDPCCPPPAAHRGNRFFHDLQGPLLPRRGVWGGLTGPAQRSMSLASGVGKGLCSPSVTADTTVTKLADKIGQNWSSHSSSFPYMALAKARPLVRPPELFLAHHQAEELLRNALQVFSSLTIYLSGTCFSLRFE